MTVRYDVVILRTQLVGTTIESVPLSSGSIPNGGSVKITNGVAPSATMHGEYRRVVDGTIVSTTPFTIAPGASSSFGPYTSAGGGITETSGNAPAAETDPAYQLPGTTYSLTQTISVTGAT